VVVQPDGKILAGGYSRFGPSVEFTLLRYHPDGSLEQSFSFDGTVTIGNGDFDRAYAVAL